jgi:hypothetical protein
MKSHWFMPHPGPARLVMLASSMAVLLGLAPVQAQQKVPDLTGVWARDAHNYPKPYLAPGRGGGIVGGYDNEYLKPWVVELLMRDNLVTRSGQAVITAHSVCYPESVPYVFGGAVMQILQGPSEINVLFGDSGQFRTIYLNRSHPAHVIPSYWGDSVGHFEGDTLVVDTVGIAVNPQSGSMGNYGTPHTEDLHLVERYRRLRDGEPSVAPTPHDDSFNSSDIISGAKPMRLTFTLEDPIAYKKPWSVTLDYLPLNGRVREYVCAENSRSSQIAPLLPIAQVPDF